MSDDLVKRARLAQFDTGVDLYGDLSDHIEELEELLKAAQDDAKEAEAYAGELEYKLAKAVRLISEKPILATYEDDVQWQKYVIAELTGGKDEWAKS